MPIKRYYATADTTITNAYREGLSTRGEDSNMGQADTLETFTIFDQVETKRTGANGSSTIVPEREAARILIKFDPTEIVGDRTSVVNGDGTTTPAAVPASARYFLRMFNAVHGHTLPNNYNIDVHSLTTAFDEGYGIDADEYKDSGTVGQSAAASWNAASYDTPAPATPATGTFHVDINPDGNFTIEVGGHDIVISPGANEGITAFLISQALDAAPFDSIVTASDAAGEVTVAAVDIGGDFITLSATLADGDSGNVLVNSEDWGGIGLGGTNGSNSLSGAVDTVAWTTPGGDYDSAVVGTQNFILGDEDLEIEVTQHVTDAMIDASTHEGLIIKLSAAEEAVMRSFYTKKFFARSSEYFFLRPVIEARYEDGPQGDSRGRLYATHPMYTDDCRLTYTHYVNGNLAIPPAGARPNVLNIYTDSAKDVLLQSQTVTADLAVGLNGAGFQTALFTIDTDLDEVYAEWVDDTGASDVVCFTETLAIKQRQIKKTNTVPDYVISMPNLKPAYLGKDPESNTQAEVARLRLTTRLRDWCPNIYTKATTDIQADIVVNAYYKVVRVSDDFVVIDYGMGTAGNNNQHTRCRFDADGSWFNLDMSLLERGYSYGLKFMFLIDGEYREQPEVFKFRVE